MTGSQVHSPASQAAPTLVIPTRNRPASLGRVLAYLAEFYPATPVLIANGSDRAYEAAYAQVIEDSAKGLNLSYRLYGSGPSLGERMVDALGSIDHEFVVVGADDDYPILEVLLDAEDHLRRNPDYVLAIGGIVSLRLFENGDFQVKLLHARSIEQQNAVQRVNEFIKWPFATSYGLVRRRHYIERCRRVDLVAFPGFGDYTVGIQDCLAGRIRALDEICYFTTTNPSHSKFRRRSALFYLERAPEVLALKDYYRELLGRQPAMTEERAESIAVRLINTRIVEMVTPAPQNRPGFGSSELFRDPEIRGQYAAFQALFSDGTEVRRRLVHRLRAVVSSVKAVAAAGTDNRGEPEIYDSLAAMESGAALEAKEAR